MDIGLGFVLVQDHLDVSAILAVGALNKDIRNRMFGQSYLGDILRIARYGMPMHRGLNRARIATCIKNLNNFRDVFTAIQRRYVTRMAIYAAVPDKFAAILDGTWKSIPSLNENEMDAVVDYMLTYTPNRVCELLEYPRFKIYWLDTYLWAHQNFPVVARSMDCSDLMIAHTAMITYNECPHNKHIERHVPVFIRD